MTIAQVMHALGGGDGAETRREIEREIFAKQCEVLDRVCERNGWRPRRLLELPASEVAGQIQSETGGKAPARDALGGNSGTVCQGEDVMLRFRA
jgi:hypothetical protein